ncbi:hypothetical protein [Dactylosporangium sp. CA-092794]|uniref:hypothetical protein n=1 Tax=Dactylosporangium sp. CA-092794 TaxID=3239929 RepID=UPI003D94AD41
MPRSRRGQRLSHSDLLLRPDTPGRGDRKLDAIIVPSARPASSLEHAAGLAEELNVPLMVLASRKARGAEIVQKIEDWGIVADVIVIDMPARPIQQLPALETTADMFVDTPFRRKTDVSAKRNLGLLLARAIGWRQVMFLDDDITIPDALDLRRAAELLDGHAAVGLEIKGMLDNSVVCHARRDLGDNQGTFVGGGALVVPTARDDGAFFPNIYNEDWFFLLDHTGIRPVTRTGQAQQLWYDPYVDPDRARGEELGDTLAEGVFAAVSEDGKIDAAMDDGYWVGFLEVRRGLIGDLLRRAEARPASQRRSHMVEALKAARGRSFLIEPVACKRFLRAWDRDLRAWQDAFGDVRPDFGIHGAVSHFGLRQSATIRLNRTGPAPKEPRLRQARKRLEDQERRLAVTRR